MRFWQRSKFSTISFRIDFTPSLRLIVGNHDRLHMDTAITVCEILNMLLVRFLLIIDLKIPFFVIDEHTHLADSKAFALLNPDDLTVMVHRLHTVAGNPEPELHSIGDGIFREAHHFKIPVIQELSDAGRHSQIADRLFDIPNRSRQCVGLISSGGDQVLPILAHPGQPFSIECRNMIYTEIGKIRFQIQRVTNGDQLIRIRQGIPLGPLVDTARRYCDSISVQQQTELRETEPGIFSRLIDALPDDISLSLLLRIIVNSASGRESDNLISILSPY